MNATPSTGWTLVTGGGGYVGSVLVGELLNAGRRVRVLDTLAHGNSSSLLHVWGKHGFDFVRGDLRDASVVSRSVEGVSEIVHLAAIVGDPACARDPELAQAVNLEATRSLLAAARVSGVRRFLFASTCSNYGRLDGGTPATEEWPLRPVSLYAETKVMAEGDVLSAGEEMTACCLRFATVFGVSPRMRFDLTVNEFARDAFLTGELVVYGQQFWRPYIHVRDAARAALTALDAPRAAIAGQVFNVGSATQNLRKQDLVGLVQATLPSTKVRFVEKDEDPRDYRVSFDKIERELSFKAGRTVAEGVEEVVGLLAAGLVGDAFGPAYRN